MAKNTDLPVADRLRQLYELQIIDSQIDELVQLKGELPIEVNDLEDEVAGMQTRIAKYEAASREAQRQISSEDINISTAEANIERYNTQLKGVKNHREFEILTKEIEDQTLNIQISRKNKEKHLRAISDMDATLRELQTKIENWSRQLMAKQNELEKIVEKTSKEEEKLRKRSEKYRQDVDKRLLASYDKVRTSFRNGLAVVPIVRSSCGGCFNIIPPQVQLEIGLHKHIIVCEHCGRILIDESIRQAEVAEA
jgi:predicted  nucleic acid-binding Zn-ribbon protein